MMAIGRIARIADNRSKQEKREPTYDQLVENLKYRLAQEKVIPIISNSVINNRIFDINDDGKFGVNLAGAEHLWDNYTIDEELAKVWAKSIKHPLEEKPFRLCRVAQYNQLKYEITAKKRYLAFLNECLTRLLEENVAKKDVDEEIALVLKILKEEEKVDIVNDLSFSQLAIELGLPKSHKEEENLLRILAELPVRIYVTTSHHDFMVRALEEVDKTPHPQVCPWYKGSKDVVDFYGPDYVPSVNEPLVYHLYGWEEEPDSMVISEDDYMEFLVNISTDRKSNIIPKRLRQELMEASLLLLGYRLRDWDFRILLRSVLKPGPYEDWVAGRNSSQKEILNVAIQLNPSIQEWAEACEDIEQRDRQEEVAENTTQQDRQQEVKPKQYEKEAREYLEKYFDETCKFTIHWDDTLEFVKKLL